MPHRSTKPPFMVERNLKIKEIFWLSSHSKVKESVQSYQLLHNDLDAKKKSRKTLPFKGEFSYTPLYWEWLEDVFTHCRDLLVAIICSMPFMHHFSFLTSIQTLFGRYTNITAQKQTFCISRRAKFLFFYWTCMASSAFHFWLSLRQGNLTLINE